MSISKVNVSGTNHQIVGSPRYATCSTEAATAAKVATIADGSSTFSLEKGARICVSFTYANTASAATLNVAGTGAKAICWQGSALVSSQYWQAGAVVDFVYDGNGWSIVGIAKDNSGQPKITANGILKGDGNGGVSAAVKGTDYFTPADVNEIAAEAAKKVDISGKVSKSGDTMTGKLTVPQVETGADNSNFFQCRKFRGEGDANTYYHAIDFGYANHDKVDFHEYGGIWNFFKNTSGKANEGVLCGSITSNGWEGRAKLKSGSTMVTSQLTENSDAIATTAFVHGLVDNVKHYSASNPPPYPVTSVNNKTGAVTLAKGDVGLGNVDNTSDANKPISNATQAALNDKQSKITANGILKGDGTGTITAADETEVELVDLPIRAESIIIPKGRMRGDVDGDGKITENDMTLINEAIFESITLTGADLWCVDANADGSVDSTDLNIIYTYLQGGSSALTSVPKFADYYNNWTYVKIDDLTGYWTAEIPIAGLTTSNNVVVNICETFPMGQFYKAEVSTGKVKIYATRPPINDIPATVVISSGSGKGSIPSCLNESSVQPEIFWATYGNTPVAAIKEAWDAGKLIKVKKDRNIYDVNKESDSLFYFYGLDGRRRGGYTCGMVQASGWSISEKCGYIIDIKGAVTLPTASWTGSDPYTQTVTTSISTANTKVDIQPSEELYDQLVADNVGYLAIKNVDGTLTAVAKGGKPSVDLTVQVTYSKVY